LIYHQTNTSPIKLISQRDLLEKKVTFEHEDSKFVFTSMVPTTDELCPLQDNIIRIETVLNFNRFWTDPESGQVMNENIGQCDLKLGDGMMAKTAEAAAFIQLPKELRKWHTTLLEYLEK